jgi:hypothetical protein
MGLTSRLKTFLKAHSQRISKRLWPSDAKNYFWDWHQFLDIDLMCDANSINPQPPPFLYSLPRFSSIDPSLPDHTLSFCCWPLILSQGGDVKSVLYWPPWRWRQGEGSGEGSKVKRSVWSGLIQLPADQDGGRFVVSRPCGISLAFVLWLRVTLSLVRCIGVWWR